MKIYNLNELKTGQLITYLKELQSDVQTPGLELKKIISKIESSSLINPEFSFAIVIENEICGVIFISESATSAYISLLYISAKFRNRGFGRKLMECAIDRLRQTELKEAYLEVLSDNQNAVKLYQSMWFEITGVIYQFRNEINSFFQRDAKLRYEKGDPFIYTMLRRNFGINKLFPEKNPIYIKFLIETGIAEFYIFYAENMISGYIVAKRSVNSLDIIDYGAIKGDRNLLFIMISHILLKETIVVVKYVTENEEILNDLKNKGFFADIKQFCMKLKL